MKAKFLLLVGFVAALPAFAQTTAEQGKVAPPRPEPEVHLFTSPMVLNVPIVPAPGLLSGIRIALTDMASNRCDGVSIRRLDLKGKSRNGSAELRVDAQTWTIEGHDKWIHLLTELLVNGQVIGTDEIPDLKSEEHSAGHGSAFISIPDAAALAKGDAVLRLTVTVADECCPPRLSPRGNRTPQQRLEDSIRN